MKKFLLLLTVLASIFAFGTACNGSDSDSSPIDSSQGSQTVESSLKTMNVSLASKSFNYDGQAHSLTIDGELPEKAVVAWQNNSLTDVGEQMVFATVRCQGYKEVSLKATLTVIGQDISAELALQNAEISVGYGEEYAFALNDVTLLPEGYSLTETYVDTSTGTVLDEKPDFGGEFRYVLQINASGYNTKVIHGDLTIARPDVTGVEITNLPTVAGASYSGKAAILPGIAWEPEINILPKGHKDVEIEYTTSDDTRIKFENGEFIASENYGTCDITVSIKGTAISQTYTVTVADCDFFYEDFEDDTKALFYQEYVMEKNEQGQLVNKLTDAGYAIPIPRGKTVVLDENGKAPVDENGNVIFVDKEKIEDNYLAFGAVSTNYQLDSVNGNNVLRVTGAESYIPTYTYVDIDGQPGDGWTAGRYRIEMDVTGEDEFVFTFFWVKDDAVNVVANSGTLSNAEAIVENGKIVIEFTITDALIGNYNTLRFAQSGRSAFDFTVDNILVVKVS